MADDRGRVSLALLGTWFPSWKMRLDLLGPPGNVTALRGWNSRRGPQARCLLLVLWPFSVSPRQALV